MFVCYGVVETYMLRSVVVSEVPLELMFTSFSMYLPTHQGFEDYEIPHL